MSSDKKHSRIDPDDFFRYLSGEMTDRERHAMERKIQQDPFAADALEGLASRGHLEARKDLARLRVRLQKRIGVRSSAVWIRIAASVAILVALGTVYFTVFSDRVGRMDRMVAESETAEPARDKGSTEEFESPGKESGEAQAAPAERERETTQEAAEEEMEPEVSGKQTEPSEIRQPDGEEAVPFEIEADSEFSAEDEALLSEKSIPSPVVRQTNVTRPTARKEGNSGGRDGQSMAEEQAGVKSAVTESLDAEPAEAMLAVTESVEVESTAVRQMTGTLRKKQPELRPEAAGPSARMVPDSIPAMPAGGMELFNRYIEGNLRFPEGDSLPEAGVVKLSFSLDSQGHPRNISIEESPGEAFSQEAERLIREGPAWTPVYRNGMLSEEKIRFSIEFRKE